MTAGWLFAMLVSLKYCWCVPIMSSLSDHSALTCDRDITGSCAKWILNPLDLNLMKKDLTNSPPSFLPSTIVSTSDGMIRYSIMCQDGNVVSTLKSYYSHLKCNHVYSIVIHDITNAFLQSPHLPMFDLNHLYDNIHCTRLFIASANI